MTVLRSTRLEALLGSTPLTSDALRYHHLELLVTGQVFEAEDLDYKRELYKRDDTAKRNLCGDVAALANTRGGILILGADEDDQGRATALPGVDLSDGEATRMQQILAGGLAPRPPVDIIPVENPAAPGTGCYVIAVAAGPRYPYGVLINNGYRYPRRVGTTIGYLTEPEIETAYRRRDAARRDQAERAGRIEATAISRLDPAEPWLVMSLVPDQPGESEINTTTFTHVKNAYQWRSPMIARDSSRWVRVLLGQRRYILDATREHTSIAREMAAELYRDGAGVFAVPATETFSQPDGSSAIRVSDEKLVITLLSGVRFLAEHARDRAGASGTAALRASFAHPPVFPVQLLNGQGLWGLSVIGDKVPLPDIQPAEAAAPLDDLGDGPGLVSTAALLADDLLHGFGVPESTHITRSGRILGVQWWSQEWGRSIVEWALRHHIKVINDSYGR
ncbi:helix-turn-helix domain-containing protein [Streptosporangium sp. NPDC001559]|uniref:AlbA family DNA-binding domain-containing protein n=1 Tax=Streptosporangium sp. NPDC001559 TaxID=3366187 RepID=UPI0036E1045A